MVEKKKEEFERYTSRLGFIEVPVLRGLHEAKILIAIVQAFDCFICGGYVRYMCSPRHVPAEPSDIDIYCSTKETFEKIRCEMEARFGLGFRHENDMSKTYSKPDDPEHPFFALPSIQLIKPIKQGSVVAVGDMETILANFDFTVIRAGYISGSKATVDADFPYDEARKLLRLKNIHCPVSSTLRCMKYARKNYFLPPFQALKLFFDWDDRDDEYKQKLVAFLEKAEGKNGLTQKEVDEMEAMMMID